MSTCRRSQHLIGTQAILHQTKVETARRMHLTDAINLFNCNVELDDNVLEDMDFEGYLTIESDSDCSSDEDE